MARHFCCTAGLTSLRRFFSTAIRFGYYKSPFGSVEGDVVLNVGQRCAIICYLFIHFVRLREVF